MKLTPPPLNIPEKTPFQNDLFGREDFANRLFNLITLLDEGLVMSINASWGEGKTSFVKMWATFLRQKGTKCIYLDAFAQDYVDDAFITIASEISSLVDSEFKKNQTPKTRLKEFKKKASKASVKLLSWGAKVGVKAAALGAIKETDIEELKEIKKLFAQDGSALISDVIARKLDNHKEDIKTIESFKTELELLANEIKSETNYPLIFIIDELDRCKPNYALDLIEKIKHFFSVKNIIFVLVMNISQLECSVRSVYGKDIDALTYLQKFINIECQLPKNTDGYAASDQMKYCKYLYSAHQLNTWEDKNALQESMATFSKMLGLSFRDLEKCYSVLTLFYASITTNTYRLPLIIAFLVIVKIKFSSIYKKLKSNELNYQELISKQELSSIFKSKEEESNIDWFIKWLMFLLFTEEEFNSLDQNDEIRNFGQALRRYNFKRQEIISFFCDRLDSFYFATSR